MSDTDQTTIRSEIAGILDLGGAGDASLNLEGALDTLLIHYKLSEDDAVIRTMRRVISQIDEVARSVRTTHSG